MRIRIGARGSRLSRAQVDEVQGIIQRDVNFDLIPIKTKGDVNKERPLYEIRAKGLFEKEVNQALLDGRVDVAIHSAKDVPLDTLYGGLTVVSIPRRGSRYDAVVTRDNKGLDELPTASIVGTSSIRRMSFLKYYRSDLVIKNIRGNIDTRIRKLQNGEYDALIVSEAALNRLGIKGYRQLSGKDFVPAAGQGGIMIIGIEGNSKINRIFEEICDPISYFEVMVEKTLISRLGVGCSIPMGLTAFLKDEELYLIAGITDNECTKLIKVGWKTKVVKDRIRDRDYIDWIVDSFDEILRERGGHSYLKRWRGGVS